MDANIRDDIGAMYLNREFINTCTSKLLRQPFCAGDEDVLVETWRDGDGDVLEESGVRQTLRW